MVIIDKNLLLLPDMTKGSDIELPKPAKLCQILKTIDVSEILTLEILKDAMLGCASMISKIKGTYNIWIFP
jgi:hypothetical protein